MSSNQDYDQTITNAPYNVMNLTQGMEPNLSNPQNISDPKYDVSSNSQKSENITSDGKISFYDPTKPMVDNYLKTNKSMYDNDGKYFDSYLFNQKFNEYIKKQTAERKLKEKVQTYDLDRIDNIQVQPYQLPLDKLLINFKNVWFKLFDDLMNKKNPIELFNTENFFYFGVTFIVVFLLYVMLSYIFE